MQIFNMSRLDSLQQAMRYDLFVDEYYPQVEEEVTMANSQEELSDKLSIAASVNVNFSAFAVDVKGHFGSSSSNSTNKEYAVKRLKSYQYTREINYMNLIALIKQKPELAEEISALLQKPVIVYDEWAASDGLAKIARDVFSGAKQILGIPVSSDLRI